MAYDQLGRTDDARAAWREALALSPDNPAVLSNLAMSLAAGGEAAKAETLLRKAVQSPQAGVVTRQDLALVLGLQGKTAEAEKLIRDDVPPPQADADLAWFRTAAAPPRSSRTPGARWRRPRAASSGWRIRPACPQENLFGLGVVDRAPSDRRARRSADRRTNVMHRAPRTLITAAVLAGSAALACPAAAQICAPEGPIVFIPKHYSVQSIDYMQAGDAPVRITLWTERLGPRTTDNTMTGLQKGVWTPAAIANPAGLQHNDDRNWRLGFDALYAESGGGDYSRPFECVSAGAARQRPRPLGLLRAEVHPARARPQPGGLAGPGDAAPGADPVAAEKRK